MPKLPKKQEAPKVKEPGERCVACSGSGKSSRGGVCYPCSGSGKRKEGGGYVFVR